MFGSEILDAAVGIIFVFILVSAICTAVREGIEAFLKTRAAYLDYGIRELLHDTQASGISRALYEHPLIYGLFLGAYTPSGANKAAAAGAPAAIPQRPRALTSGGNLPTYIPSRNFALALMDIAARGPRADPVNSGPEAPPVSLDSIRKNIANVENPAVQRAMLTAIDAAQGDLDKAQANIEAWYNSGMDRVSGWYKRSTQWVLFWIGLVVAIAMNVDAVRIANYLYQNEPARAAVVNSAKLYKPALDQATNLMAAAGGSSSPGGATSAGSSPPAGSKTTAGGSSSTGGETAVSSGSDSGNAAADAIRELFSLNLPIGWTKKWQQTLDWPWQNSGWIWERLGYCGSSGLGWLLTALAATLGAPFWFDVLNKVMIIRSTVKPDEKSPTEASKDRQPGKPTTEIIAGDRRGEDGTGTSRAATGGATPGAPLQDDSSPSDDESDVSGCDATSGATEVTSDEDLPAAEGGVG